MLSHQVSLFLSEVAKVSGGSACEDLSRWDSSALSDDGASGDNSERFNLSSTANCRAHANEGVVFESAGIELRIWSNIHVLPNSHLVASLLSVASDSSQVLDGRVFADSDRCSIASDNNTVPERGSFTEADVSDHGSVWSNPITL